MHDAQQSQIQNTKVHGNSGYGKIPLLNVNLYLLNRPEMRAARKAGHNIILIMVFEPNIIFITGFVFGS